MTGKHADRKHAQILKCPFWEMHWSDRLSAQHNWNTGVCWPLTEMLCFKFNDTCRGIFIIPWGLSVFRLMHAGPSAPPLWQHTVRIEIVCSYGSACQLLHRIYIIQQPRGWREQGARVGMTHGGGGGEETHLGKNKITRKSAWKRCKKPIEITVNF